MVLFIITIAIAAEDNLEVALKFSSFHSPQVLLPQEQELEPVLYLTGKTYPRMCSTFLEAEPISFFTYL
jgi:hypothetical protein